MEVIGIAIGIAIVSYVYSAALRETRGEYEERLRIFDPDSDSDPDPE